MRRLIYRRAAQRDLVEIVRYFAEHDAPDAAKRVRKRLTARCERIAALGVEVGRPRGYVREGLRSIPQRPYIIFFKYLADGSVENARVLHGARDIAATFASEKE